MISQIENRYKNNQSFTLVTEMSDTDSLLSSDILICDWSGTAIEYALGLEKPVIFIDTTPRVRNPNWKELKSEPLEISIREKVGQIISPTNLNDLSSAITQLLRNDKTFPDQMKSLRKEFVYNLGLSEIVGPEEIKKLLKTL